VKAVVAYQYGSADDLVLEEVPVPVPKSDEVLIKVCAASVNPLDWHLMRGTPFLVRLSEGFSKPRNKILGADVAGVVEYVGEAVKTIKTGDEVFGELTKLGAFAEYVCAKESALVIKPSKISFEEAASIPVAGLTAIQGLRTHGKLQAGEEVLINGASGGVGTLAVQLAKHFGAKVTGVCSTGNIELVKDLGADNVIDYKKDDFVDQPIKYDMIANIAGNRSVRELKHVLKVDGRCLVIGYSTAARLAEHMLLGPVLTVGTKKKVGIMPTASMNKNDLSYLADLLQEGSLRPVIDRKYCLEEVPDAISYVEKGHAPAKVVITL
jgi:NADPH:quinone reductase-like Zn-dependent oxidoreductase